MNDVVTGLAHALARSPRCSTLRAWQTLASGARTFDEYLEEQRRNETLTYLTIDTTAACDLTCAGMCYYNPDISRRRPALDPTHLESAIRDAHRELGLKNLVFAGKEPLLNAPLLFRLLAFANRLPGPRIETGIVTNGRHIVSRWGELKQAAESSALTFLDISLDSGDGVQHDRIRGAAGTFDLAWAALERCSRELAGVRVGTSSVIRQDNGSGLLDLIERAAPWNRHFFLTPIQPPVFSSTPPLPWSAVAEFLDTLHALMSGPLAHAGIEVMVSLLGLHLDAAAKDGFVAWDAFQEDSQGQCFVEHRPGDNRLILHAQVLPETGLRVARITSSGAYLPNAHFLQAPQPERFAVGSIAEDSIVALYHRAVADGSLLHDALRSREVHVCKDRPCWSACFGGVVGAEHAIVEARALTTQPRMCLKVFNGSDSEQSLGMGGPDDEKSAGGRGHRWHRRRGLLAPHT